MRRNLIQEYHYVILRHIECLYLRHHEWDFNDILYSRLKHNLYYSRKITVDLARSSFVFTYKITCSDPRRTLSD